MDKRAFWYAIGRQDEQQAATKARRHTQAQCVAFGQAYAAAIEGHDADASLWLPIPVAYANWTKTGQVRA